MSSGGKQRYITNSGAVLEFDTAACAVFGFEAGDRVVRCTRAGAGRTGTVVGVRSNTLWVHIDGEKGARMIPAKAVADFRKTGWERFPQSLDSPSATETVPSGRASAASADGASSVGGADPESKETVVFVVDKKRVVAQREKLMKNFFFRSLLTSGMKESSQREIELRLDIRHEIFAMIVAYLESDSQSPAAEFISEENDIELLAAADMLQISGLRMDCYSHILQSISAVTPPERKVDILQAGALYGLPQVEESVLYYLQHYGDDNALLLAVQKGYQDVARLLVDRFGPQWRSRRLFQPEFLQSVQRGFPPEFLKLLLDSSASHRRTLASTDGRGNTALHLVCASDASNGTDVARFLLDAGVAVDSPNAQGSTGLALAAAYNRPDIAVLLLSRGANVNYQDNAGNTPLHVAIEKRHFGVGVLLMDFPGVSLEVKNHRGRRPLTALNAAGPGAVLELLNSWPRPPSSSSSLSAPSAASAQRGGRPQQLQLQAPFHKPADRLLHWFAGEHNYHVVRVLLESGAVGVNCRGPAGDTLLHKATADGSCHAIRYLADCGADLDAADADGNAPLHLAALALDAEAAAELLAAGARPSALNLRRNTPLHVLPLGVDEAYRPPLPARDAAAPVPLAAAGRVESATLPVRARYAERAALAHRRCRSADGGSSDDDDGEQSEPSQSSTRCHAACELTAKPALAATAPAAAAVAAAAAATSRAGGRRGGVQAAAVAAGEAHVRLCQLLVAAGADVRAGNSRRNTPLHQMARALCAECVRELLGARADPNARNDDMETPLHSCWPAGDQQTCSCAWPPSPPAPSSSSSSSQPPSTGGSRAAAVAALLLGAGSDINARNKASRTALHLAVARGDEAGVRLLLSRGAAVDVGDEFGDTPLAVAHHHGFTQIKRLLEAETCRVQ
eukprot:m51a1_g6054 putative protein unc- isoform a (909) ;mRNA; f:220640-224441